VALLEFHNVSFINEGRYILKGINADIEADDFISIIGPSGSGKSTFLRLCSNLISPSEGEIMYKGKNVEEYEPTELRREIVYCSQTPYLFGDTVAENIYFPFTIRGMKPDKEKIDAMFSMFHMSSDYLSRDVRNLSGGERQRIALIRSLLFKPEVLLLDEITSALDAENAKTVEDVIVSFSKKGTTILWVTHNAEQSRKYANKLFKIENGQLTSVEVIK